MIRCDTIDEGVALSAYLRASFCLIDAIRDNAEQEALLAVADYMDALVTELGTAIKASLLANVEPASRA